MTNDDRLRALDGVDAPDQWDDIIDRAATAPDLAQDRFLAATSRRRPRVLGVAAAAVVIVGLIAAVLALRGNDDSDQRVATGEGLTTAPTDNAGVPWRSEWRLTTLTGTDGHDYLVADGTTDAVAPTLDLTSPGTLSMRWCNRGSGPATIEGRRLQALSLAMTEMACADQRAMEGERALVTLLNAGPMVDVDGDTLTLAADGSTATFERVTGGGETSSTSTTIFGGYPSAFPAGRWSAASGTVDDLIEEGGLVLSFHRQVTDRRPDSGIVSARPRLLWDIAVDPATGAWTASRPEVDCPPTPPARRPLGNLGPCPLRRRHRHRGRAWHLDHPDQRPGIVRPRRRR